MQTRTDSCSACHLLATLTTTITNSNGSHRRFDLGFRQPPNSISSEKCDVKETGRSTVGSMKESRTSNPGRAGGGRRDFIGSISIMTKVSWFLKKGCDSFLWFYKRELPVYRMNRALYSEVFYSDSVI